MRLYLDGVNDLLHKIEDYDVEVTKDLFNFKKDIWLRATIIPHTALTLVRTIVVQFFRGTGNIIGGALQLDGERVLMGLNDYLSLLIQAIALPILGVITFIMPKTGYYLLSRMAQSFDAPRVASDIIYKHENNPKQVQCSKAISEAIMGVFGAISAFIQTLTLCLEHLLSFNCAAAYDTLHNTGALIVKAPQEGFTNCSKKEFSRTIFTAHRITLESFNPSALL